MIKVPECRPYPHCESETFGNQVGKGKGDKGRRTREGGQGKGDKGRGTRGTLFLIYPMPYALCPMPQYTEY
jgi:hypothetical protein